MKELVVTTDVATYVFITRDDTEPFTVEEAQEYLRMGKVLNEGMYIGNEGGELSFPDRPIIPTSDAEFNDEEAWQIPDDKMRRHLFRKDLQIGIDFCVKKYGQPKEVIQAEARRLGAGGF